MFGTIRKIPSFQVQSKVTGELFTVARSLTEGTGISAFSLIHEELPPGHRTSSPHSHSKKDEIYLVMSGEPSVYVNGKKSMMAAGDYVIFKSGQAEFHYLVNETQENIELLLFSSCPPDDVIEYQK